MPLTAASSSGAEALSDHWLETARLEAAPLQGKPCGWKPRPFKTEPCYLKRRPSKPHYGTLSLASGDLALSFPLRSTADTL